MARLILSGVAEAGETIISLYNVFFRIVSLTLCRAVINKFGQLKIVEEFFLDISEFVKWNDIIKGKIWNWKGIFSKQSKFSFKNNEARYFFLENVIIEKWNLIILDRWKRIDWEILK